MADKKPYLETGESKEFKINKEFDDNFKLKEKIGEILHDIVLKTSIEVFKNAGFEEIEEPTSVYATGKPYGFGIDENKFKIRLAGKVGSIIEKQTILGAKKLESEINITTKGNVLIIVYQIPKIAFFKTIKTQKIIINLKNIEKIKKELSKIFKKFAEKELEYMINTKMGVEDRVDANRLGGQESILNTTTYINENKKQKNMKPLTLKELYSDDFENNSEEFQTIPNEEKNIDKIINLNTQSIDEKDKEKKLLFDDEENSIEDEGLIDEISGKYSNLDKYEMKSLFYKILQDNFGTKDIKKLTPIEKKEFFKKVDEAIISKEETVEEITTAGPAGAGAGRYDTPFAFKNTGMFKQAGKSTKKDPSKVGSPYNIPAGDKVYEGKEIEQLENEIVIEGKKNLTKTNYYKTKTSKRPKVDKDYNIIPETKDSFWQTVKVDPNTHPLGMPGIKPNSKEEWEAATKGDVNKLKRMGLKEENEKENKERQIKKKFFSEAENLKQGINKRYLITEKTTEEYEKERWAKLTNFKLYETIAKTEEDLISENIDSIKETIEIENLTLEQTVDSIINENKQVLKEEIIIVEKPGTKFGLTYKFYKKDFINENKKYILDLNSMVFVQNPNTK